jgi:predicted secreted protein
MGELASSDKSIGGNAFMKTLAIAIAAIAMTATSAAAAEPKAADAKQEKKEKKICKSEKMTGSLTRVRRTCMTQREWDQVAEASRRGVNDLDRQQNINPGNTGG